MSWLSILCVWRFASLLSREKGPYGVLDKLRYLFGVRWNERSEMYGTNELARGLLCVWCSSVWWGVGLALLWWHVGQLPLWQILPAGLAYSAGAIIIDSVILYYDAR